LRVLVVGSGGREHALAWRFGQDSASHNLYAAPGNPGIASLAVCHDVAASDVPGLLDLADSLHPDLTVVGPEVPLAAGLVDAYRSRGFRIFGPTRRAARLESSKVFAKELMVRHGIPTAAFAVFDRADDALEYVRRVRRPLVVKADGLAAGKGVVVADHPAEAEQAVIDMMIHRVHGPAGERVLIEERLEGQEASVLALVHGMRVWPLRPAQDYKRAQDGDVGPNTGGMGAFAPAPLAPALAAEIVGEVLEPVAAAMASEGSPYTGVLYAGVMVTEGGPRVLEFNCRFGDPEAQVLLPLLDRDLASALLAVMAGDDPGLQWRSGAAVCVVLASPGYPGSPVTGQAIRGLDRLPPEVLAFQAGTAPAGGAVVTAGGRVLNVVGRGDTLPEARAHAYRGVAAIEFDGMQFRTDIAAGTAPVIARQPVRQVTPVTGSAAARADAVPGGRRR
jgi:phosphoribosylamine--glycine ligase